jgi:hypothetical protein
MPRRLLALAAAGLVLGLAGCGGGSDDATGSGAGGAAGAGSDAAATALLKQARAAAAGASTVSVSGATTRGGQSYTYSMDVVNGRGETDTVTVDGGTLKYIKVGGGAYMKTVGGINNEMSASSPPALKAKLETHWLAVDPAGLPAMAPSFQDVFSFLGKYPSTASPLDLSVPADAQVSSAGEATVGGVRATRLDFSAAMPAGLAAEITSQGQRAPARLTGSVFVAKEGTAYPVAVRTNTGVDIKLSAWNSKIRLAAPPKKSVLTMDQLLGGLSG